MTACRTIYESKLNRKILRGLLITSVDALAAGVAMHADLSTVYTIWLHVSIVLVLTFSLSLVGLFLGKQIMKLLKGKYEISGIVGGIILILLAVWVVVSHYVPGLGL